MSPSHFEDHSADVSPRLVDPNGTEDEQQLEAALRPKKLADFPLSLIHI